MFDIVFQLIIEFIQTLLPVVLVLYFFFGLVRKWL